MAEIQNTDTYFLIMFILYFNAHVIVMSVSDGLVFKTVPTCKLDNKYIHLYNICTVSVQVDLGTMFNNSRISDARKCQNNVHFFPVKSPYYG